MRKKPAIYCVFALLCLTCTFCSSDPAEENLPVIKDWAMNALWDDGQAEVAYYAAERTIYGEVREFEYVFILVKEEFNKEFNVKTDNYDRNDLFSVMKVNKFARIETQNYPYHLLTSLFFKREEPAILHKMTSSSQEWCGNTFKLFENNSQGYTYTYHSYWDGQGSGTRAIEGIVLFEDQLSYSLRALHFKEGLNFMAEVVESQVTNKANSPKVYNAKFNVQKDQAQGKEAWKVSVILEDGKTNHYWFATSFPNILLRQQTWDHQNLELKSAERTAYWENVVLQQ